jgi:predicted nucleic acid-binding protein
LVVDTYAWVVLARALRRTPTPSLVGEFRAAVLNDQLRGSHVVKLEVLHGAQSPADFRAAEDQLDVLPPLPVTRAISQAAVTALRELAASAPAGSPLHHRVGHGDVLVAATAAERGFGVLHYDHHFDRLREVLEFDSVWIAEPGDY